MIDHGTAYGYVRHTQLGVEPCPPCRRAHADRAADYTARLYLHRGPLSVDPTGTVRRLRALAAIGWPQHDIAARIGVTASALRQWTTSSRLHLHTAEDVAAVYRLLSDTDGPSGRSRGHAAAVGWAPPIAWDDDTIDDPATRAYGGQPAPVDDVVLDRALAGKLVALPRAGRIALTHRLTAAGRSAREISAVLGVTDRSVVRYRAAA